MIPTMLDLSKQETHKSSISVESTLLNRQVSLHLQYAWNLFNVFFSFFFTVTTFVFKSILVHPTLAFTKMNKITLCKMSICSYKLPASNDFLWLWGSVLKLFIWFLENFGLYRSQVPLNPYFCSHTCRFFSSHAFARS